MPTYIRSCDVTRNYGRNYENVKDSYPLRIKIEFTIGYSPRLRKTVNQKIATANELSDSNS